MIAAHQSHVKEGGLVGSETHAYPVSHANHPYCASNALMDPATDGHPGRSARPPGYRHSATSVCPVAGFSMATCARQTYGDSAHDWNGDLRGTGNRRGTARVIGVEQLPSALHGRGGAGEATSAVSWRPGPARTGPERPTGRRRSHVEASASRTPERRQRERAPCLHVSCCASAAGSTAPSTAASTHTVWP